jgi:hypothetical protein
MKAKMLMIGAGVAIALPLIPQSPPQAAIADSPPICANDPYGVDGQLSSQDISDLDYIGFPQTAQDMRGRFGSPWCFTSFADYYRVEGTANFVEVFYSGSAAEGWEVWEVQP